MIRISSLLLVLLLVVAAGCSSPAASDEESQPDATATPTFEPTAEPTEDTGGVPSFEPGAGELADLLPTEIGGMTLEYSSASGADVMGSDGITPEVQAFFDEIGASESDLSSAFGFAFDSTMQTGISIIAFRVAGGDEGALREAYLDAIEAEGGIPIGEDTTLGGKEVTAIGFSEATNGYLYVNDDVVYIVSGEPVALAEEALAALP